ncbi:MAG: tetratricopeptide repeat protein, partial [candidate division NC10 bacterium]|nr:tetratricopeptide repeat protein [candidate division NC10 bacterium]
MRASRRAGLVIASAFFLVGLWPGALLAQGTTPDRSILFYQGMLQRNPRDARTYYRLGDAYIQKARESGDVTYFDLAEQALRRALEIRPQYSDALRHLAFALYSRHDFAGAANEAGKAIALNPADSHAYGILGDAYLETGQYGLTAETYEKMLHHRADLYSLSRRAGLRALRGDAEGAIADMKQAIEVGRASGQPRESVAWAQWQFGSDYFALGNLPGAEAQFLEALKTYPNYYRALAGLAQVQAAQGKYPEAIELYQKAIAIIPLPDYASALG